MMNNWANENYEQKKYSSAMVKDMLQLKQLQKIKY